MSVVLSSSTPGPTQTDGSDGMMEPTQGGSSSTLYLYTFLVTLILLCSISAVIITRSYYIRRRFRRQVEEALRNGQVLSPSGLLGLSSSATSKLFGTPPKLWDVWVQPYSTTTCPAVTVAAAQMQPETHNVNNESTSGEFPWIELRPLAAEFLRPPRPKPRPIQKPSDASDSRVNGPAAASASSPNASTSFLFSKPWMRRRTPQSSSSSVPMGSAAATPNTKLEGPGWKRIGVADKDPYIRVVTLITMPSPHRSRPTEHLRAESEGGWSTKGKGREERLDMTPIAMGITELKVLLEDEDTQSPPEGQI